MSSTDPVTEDMTASTSGVVCPADVALKQFTLSARLGQLCGFWSRDVDDALSRTAELVAAGLHVPGRTLQEAIDLLQANGDMGTLRLAGYVKKSMREQMAEPALLRELPEEMTLRVGRAVHGCSYIIEPFGKLRCRNRGAYNVAGRQGCYCDLHARRVVKTDKWKAECAARKTARRKGR
jgi:hypothetical protein